MTAEKAVLIVDDEAILLMSLRQEVSIKFGSDIACYTALSAEEGLERSEKLHDEHKSLFLVISDWLMPGMKGDDFLRRVRAMHPEAKLVMLSGHATEQQRTTIAKDI